MTNKPQKRDNQYYLDRLRNDHPAVYSDFQAGKFKNAAEAFIAAGLRKQKSPLDQLRSAWSRASASEQALFKAEIGCTVPTTVQPASSARLGLAQPIAIGTVHHVHGKRKLPKAMAEEVLRIIDRRGLKIGDVMREMGLNPRDASLGMALRRGTLIQSDLFAAVEQWVMKYTNI